MKIFKMTLDLTKQNEYKELFSHWLNDNFNAYNRFYIHFMEDPNGDKNKDPDLIMNFYDIQLQVITYFT